MPRKKQTTDTPEVARKGIKTSRGTPIFYNEKKQRTNLTLTPTAVKGLEEFAEQLNLSISEFIERIGRGIIPVLLKDGIVENGASIEEKIAGRVVEMLGKKRLFNEREWYGMLEEILFIT